MNFLALSVLLAILPTLVSGLKCWTNDPSGNPYKYTEDISGAEFCVRYKFACDGSGGLCQGKSVGTQVTVYTAVGASSIDTMSKTPQVYIDLLYCSTDFCNSPDAVKPTATMTGKTASTIQPTTKSGGSRKARDVRLCLLSVFSIIIFLL